MKWSWFGRAAMALVSALAFGLSMTACGGNTIAYLWAVGGQYKQIIGYKVDNNTGNLTAIQHSPFSTNGSNPVDILVTPAGRYVYVIDQGTYTSTSNSADAGISAYAVGGDGALTFQQSYGTEGYGHLWAEFDATGNYLFVLDRYSPSGDGRGAITAYSVDANTGRLLEVSQTAATPSGGIAPKYLEVGKDPLMMGGNGSCLFTANQADQSITAYSASSGQLTVPTTGTIFPNTIRMTSIVGSRSGSYVMITDAGTTSTTSGTNTPGSLVPFTIAGGCGLTPFNLGAVSNDPTANLPVYAFTEASNNYVYVLNQSSTTTATSSPSSTITIFNIVGGGLKEQSGNNPTGNDPVCMVEDPTHKYMYVSGGSTITGYYFTSTEGPISALSRGSTFTTGDTQTGCLALSGSVDD